MKAGTTPQVVTDPEMEAIYEGIRVSFYGEWSDLIALGHHDAHRVARAYRQHHEARCGELTDWSDAEMARQATWRWALFTRADGAWEFTDTAEHRPGSLPVTFLAIG